MFLLSSQSYKGINKQTLVCSLLTFSLSATAVFAAGPTTSGSLKVPTTTTISGSIGCSNSGGSITFDSNVQGYANIGFNVLYQQTLSNDNKTLSYVGNAAQSMVTFTPTSFSRKDTVGLITGNPYVYFKLGSNTPQYLGRCVDPQGLKFNMTFPSSVDLSVIASGTADSCTNKGSSIKVDYTKGIVGTPGTFYFTNQQVDPNNIYASTIVGVRHVQIPEDLIAADNTLHKSNIGGNPFVSYNLVDCTPYYKNNITNPNKACGDQAYKYNLMRQVDSGQGTYPYNGNFTTYNPNISNKTPATNPPRCKQLL